MSAPHLLRETLREYTWGRSDPCSRLVGATWQRATLTPAGPGAISISGLDGSEPSVETAGPGGRWLGGMSARMMGAHDTGWQVIPVHEPVREAMRHWGSLRIGASFTPYHELLPAVLGQRITAADAARQWFLLVRTFGEPAPGPWGLWLPPPPDVLRRVPYFRLHGLGIERKRAMTLAAVAEHGGRFVGDLDTDLRDPAALTASLRGIDGVGPWTAAVAGSVAFGDPDALHVGDFHVKNTIAWALTGRPRGTDDEMLETLHPYSGQRQRVVRWLTLAGWSAPRHGPGRRNPRIASL